jgi:hypothetical protein
VKSLKDLREAVSPAQQAAIAIAKKKKGEKPLNEKDPCWDTHKQVGMKKKGGKMVPNCVPKESTNEKFDVKYAKSKRGPISVRSFDSANDAKKFLDSMRKQGFNGIISKKGQPVSMQRMKDMQKEGVAKDAHFVKGDGFKASSEKSKSGGYRAKMINPQGKVSYLGGTSYKTPAAAKGEADAYMKAYFGHPSLKANDRGADRAVHQYRQSNKDKLMSAKKESVDEAMTLADIRRKKEREERRKRDHDNETRSQRMNRKVYGNMMGGLKKEDVNEAVNYFNVAKAFDDYAKKHGGIDKKDFMKVGAFVRQLGRESDVNKQDKTFMAMKKYISAMDTDPRDGVLQIFQKHGMWKNGRIMREGLEEKAVSKAQQKFFGMVRAKQKGEMDDASPEVAKAAKSMSKKDVKDFAKTKHKGLPDKVDEVNKAHDTMFKAAFRKKEAEREKAEREKRLRDKGWVRNDRGGMSKVKESTELAEFSDAQLQQLKKAYADLEKINVASPTYKKLKAMIARMDKGALEKVARAKVKFVSQIAARELAAKGVKLKASEYMESFQEQVFNAKKAQHHDDHIDHHDDQARHHEAQARKGGSNDHSADQHKVLARMHDRAQKSHMKAMDYHSDGNHEKAMAHSKIAQGHTDAARRKQKEMQDRA